MNEHELLPAKATTSDDQSDGIVVSFSSEWHQRLLDGKVRAVIRKRIPKTIEAKWLYFHVNSPVSAICGRARIQSVFEVSQSQACAISGDLMLTATDIANYFGTDKKVGCYKLMHTALAKQSLSTDAISKHLVYYPPQSFLILSRSGKAVLDKMAGFHGESKGK